MATLLAVSRRGLLEQHLGLFCGSYLLLTLLVYTTPHCNAILYPADYGILEIGEVEYGRVGGVMMAGSSLIEVEEMTEREGGRAPQITVVLTPEIVERLRGVAARKGVKPSVLLRMWAIEKLNEEGKEREEGR